MYLFILNFLFSYFSGAPATRVVTPGNTVIPGDVTFQPSNTDNIPESDRIPEATGSK